MKKIFTTLLLATSFALNAQDRQNPDNVSHSVMVAPVPCSGIAVGKAGEIHPVSAEDRLGYPPLPAAHQAFIDSVKAAKMLQNDAAEGAGGVRQKTTAVRPVMGVNFMGTAYTGANPSDASIAICDSGYIVSVANNVISFFKSNGTMLFQNRISSFLPYAGINVTHPQVIYDTHNDRFIFVCQDYPIVDTGKLYISFSRSYNPSASTGWYCYRLYGNPAFSNGFDLPKIGVNDSELFITGNLYSSSSSYTSFVQPIIQQVDKLAGYAGAGLSSIYYPYVAGGTFGLVPVTNGQSASIRTGMHIISTNNYGGSSVNIYHISGNLRSAPTVTYSTTSATTYTVPSNARQLGTALTLQTSDCRVQNAFILDSIIHFVFSTDGGSGTSGIAYNRLDLRSTVNTSTVLSTSGIDYAYPTVASYATTSTNPSVMIGFCASGSTIYPELRAVNCDSSMSWSATSLIHAGAGYAGTAAAGVFPWGAYCGSSRKHNSTAPSVWMTGGFGSATHNWDTWVAEIHDAITTPCPIPTGLFANAITTTGVALHWTAVGGAINYNIQYKPSSSSTWTSTTSAVTNKTLTGLIPDTHYDYQVQTMCSDSSVGTFSSSDTFTTKRATIGISELEQRISGSVYPNPATGSFTVEFNVPDAGTVAVEVTDVTGRVVCSLFSGNVNAGENVMTFERGRLPAGVYMLLLKADSKVTWHKKLVIAE